LNNIFRLALSFRHVYKHDGAKTIARQGIALQTFNIELAIDHATAEGGEVVVELTLDQTHPAPGWGSK
jgi:hypothetical protein